MHDGEGEPPARFEDAVGLAERPLRIVDVHEAHEEDGEVGVPVREGQRRRVGQMHGERRVGLACQRDHRRRGVHGLDPMPERHEIAREAALPAADVQRAPAWRRQRGRNWSRW